LLPSRFRDRVGVCLDAARLIGREMRNRSSPHHAGFFRVSSQKNDVAPPWLCGAGCSRLRRRRLCSLPVQPPWCFVATSAASAFSPAQMEKAVANTGGQAL
jgi:hypothetical protein